MAVYEFKGTAAIGRLITEVQRLWCPQSECEPFNVVSGLPESTVFGGIEGCGLIWSHVTPPRLLSSFREQYNVSTHGLFENVLKND